jgi:CheY-like chemotaxis protein
MARKRKTVLLIDDNPRVCAQVQEILEGANIRPAVHDSAFGALVTILALRPDIVLLDTNMPDLDGPEFARMLKSTPALHRTPLVLFSDGTNEELSAMVERSGADAFIRKTKGLTGLAEAMEAMFLRFSDFARRSKIREDKPRERLGGLTRQQHSLHRKIDELTEMWVAARAQLAHATGHGASSAVVARHRKTADEIEQLLHKATQRVVREYG